MRRPLLPPAIDTAPRHPLAALALALSVATVATSAAADNLYKVLDLGPIDPTVIAFPGGGNITFGINNKNQVAFARMVDGDVHAHVFLPVSDYGLNPGVYDLHLDGTAPNGDPYFGSSDWSIATDISDDGLVVGGSGDSSFGVSVARIWRLDEATASPTRIPTRSIQSSTIVDGMSTPAVQWSVAHAVTNGVPGTTGVTVRIVGEVIADHCSGGDRDPTWGFTVTIPSGVNPAASQMVALRPTAGSRQSVATGVNTANGLPVGDDRELVSEGCPECGSTCASNTCPESAASENEPLTWPSAMTTPSALGLLPDPTVADQATSAYSINDAGGVVGWGNLSQPNPGGCIEQAGFWETPSANQTPLVLGYTMPTGEADHESRAYALNEPDAGCFSVVGYNTSIDQGLIWCFNGTIFSAEDLENIRVPCNGLSPITIRQAHDINDGRFIVGIGESSIGARAIVLTAGADIDRDFVVDSADFGLLLAQYGCTSCWTNSACLWCDTGYAADLDGDGNADCYQCVADLNCDGSVDSGDLGALLGQWGIAAVAICTCGSSEPPPMVGGGEDDGPTTIDEAITAMGFASFAQLAEWASTATPTQLDAAALTLKSLVSN